MARPEPGHAYGRGACITALVLIGALLLLPARDFPVAFAMAGASTAYLPVQGEIPLVVVARPLTEFFLSISREPWVVLRMLNVLWLVLGCLMESIAILLILTPVRMDLITKGGIDPGHCGVVLTLNLMIGLLTPPVGMVLFVMVRLANISVTAFTTEGAIFMLVLVVVLFLIFLITYAPGLVIFLPHLVMGR